MKTNDWNQMHSTKARRSTTAGPVRPLSAAVIALLLLSAAGFGGQNTTNPPVRVADANAVPNALAAGDEQPVADELMRRLWRDRVAAPKSDERVQDRADLTDLIERVRSVKFQPKSSIIVPDIVAEPSAANPPAEIPPITQPVKEPAPAPAALAPTTSEEPMPGGTMEALRQLLADPNQVSDPAEMAELLFLSGRAREAAVFYRKALDIATRSAPAANEDRAWILLQLGNCLRETDLTQARAMYTALATEYPDSPWAELAKAQSQFLAWSETDRPRQWVLPAKGQEAQGRLSAQPSQP